MTTETNSRNTWEQKAKTRQKNETVLAAFARTKIEFLRTHLPDLQSAQTLEVGCGDGYLSRYLNSHTELLGVDSSAAMLAGNPHTKKALASVFALPFNDATFDLVLESNMFHHLESPAKALEEMKRVSKKYICLIEPNAQSLPVYITHRIDPTEHLCLRYNRKYLESLCSKSGLRIIDSVNAGWITPNKVPGFLVRPLALMERFIPGGFFSMVLAST